MMMPCKIYPRLCLIFVAFLLLFALFFFFVHATNQLRMRNTHLHMGWPGGNSRTKKNTEIPTQSRRSFAIGCVYVLIFFNVAFLLRLSNLLSKKRQPRVAASQFKIRRKSHQPTAAAYGNRNHRVFPESGRHALNLATITPPVDHPKDPPFELKVSREVNARSHWRLATH
uniref:Uncharacterized protein n=1 Tax=Anopheles darlingi TaxID=43151 RepID=A0A2M4D5R0_ANODA